MGRNFFDLFSGKKPLVGMLHLAGKDIYEKIDRAIKEEKIYEEGGFNGAIIEDYHSSIDDAISVLDALQYISLKIPLGINILKNPYLSFELADKYGTDFVQFDTIQASAGDEFNPHRFNEERFLLLRKKYPDLCVFGGVRFKYIPPTGKTLEEDIKDGMLKCDAIVTTGAETGIETPIEKLRDFKEIMSDFPLIVGAGVNDKNITEQIKIADGAIIGSYVKDYNTQKIVQKERVRRLVNLITK
jgi:predicted TIM-barrel enzyme